MARDVDPSGLAPVSTARGPHGQLELSSLRDQIRTALAALPPALREAVVLRDLQEFSYQEIADRLHLPEGTVKSRINRGRSELAKQLTRLDAGGQDSDPTTGGGTA
jgi:RNA polymerase sigma-70 factor (ECF subfamily)